MANYPELSKKSRRCYHRVISGLERGGQVRFLTLTSSLNAPQDIQRSWRCLYMRMTRRGLINGYIKCTESAPDGRLHLHILYRGSYISQRLLSHWWAKIHASPVLDIRLVRPFGSKSRIANYMAKYMSKDTSTRYSWSWGWVWRCFATHWVIYKRWWFSWLNVDGQSRFSNCLTGWRLWLRGVISLDVDYMSLDLPPHLVITYL